MKKTFITFLYVIILFTLTSCGILDNNNNEYPPPVGREQEENWYFSYNINVAEIKQEYLNPKDKNSDIILTANYTIENWGNVDTFEIYIDIYDINKKFIIAHEEKQCIIKYSYTGSFIVNIGKENAGGYVLKARDYSDRTQENGGPIDIV